MTDQPKPTSRSGAWHLLDRQAQVVCGKGRHLIEAATQYDARGLRETLAMISGWGGKPCPLCAARAKRLGT